MNEEPASPVKKPVSDDTTHTLSIGLPLVGIFVLFVLGVRASDEAFDREIFVLVRFISLLVLAMSVFTAVVVGFNYKWLKQRWMVGQISAGLMALSAGFLWSASAYGAGFGTLIMGVSLITLLMFREFGKSSQRRRIGKQARARR